MSMCKTTLAPRGQLHMEKSYLGKAGCTTGNNPPLEVAPGQGEIHVNNYRRQTMHCGKVSTGNGPHSSDGEIHTLKPTFIQGVFRKIAEKRGTQIASCAHIYMAF